MPASKITSADCVQAIMAIFAQKPITHPEVEMIYATNIGPADEPRVTKFATLASHWKRQWKKSYLPNQIPEGYAKYYLEEELVHPSSMTPQALMLSFGMTTRPRNPLPYNPAGGKITERAFAAYEPNGEFALWGWVFEQDGKIIHVSVGEEG